MRSSWESWDCSAWRRLKGSMCINTLRLCLGWKGRLIKRTEPDSSQCCWPTGKDAMNTNWNTRHSSFFRYEGVSTPEQVAQRGCRDYHPWGYWKSNLWATGEQPASYPTLSWGMRLLISRGPIPPQILFQSFFDYHAYQSWWNRFFLLDLEVYKGFKNREIPDQFSCSLRLPLFLCTP